MRHLLALARARTVSRGDGDQQAKVVPHVKTLRSYLAGQWFEAKSGFRTIQEPCGEQTIAQASTEGADFAAALQHAREKGGPALRALSIAERAKLLAAASKALHTHRDELIQLSLESCGTHRKDAKFDLDGATGTLHYYSAIAGERSSGLTIDGDGVQLGRSARSWGQHIRVPRQGVAVHINAFNFPAWGFAEKAACAWLAGMPVITKPATSTAVLAERCIEILIDADVLPEGALSLVCGSMGDTFDHLQPQDVVAFTGSADTALVIRSHPNLLRRSVRVNVEADSLNAAVLAPDVESGDETMGLFYRDVIREMTQKSGQKCTAVRRILVPSARMDEVQAELADRLSSVVVGDPREESVTMGPLATQQQLEDAVSGVQKLSEVAEVVHGTGARVEGVGAQEGVGYYFAPTMLRVPAGQDPGVVQQHEVFGPVATLIPYEGDPGQAACLVAGAEGTLVTSVYSDDVSWLQSYVEQGGASTGRLYVGSEKGADQAPGSGVALPQVLHGGPGRAGGGEELGGWRGVSLYQQRLAVMGDRATVERMVGER